MKSAKGKTCQPPPTPRTFEALAPRALPPGGGQEAPRGAAAPGEPRSVALPVGSLKRKLFSQNAGGAGRIRQPISSMDRTRRSEQFWQQP